MPQHWIHEFFDLIVFGNMYHEIHKKKDAAWKTLGANHRRINHEWYNEFGHEWNFMDMYPAKLKMFLEAMQKKHGEKAEEFQVWVAHDIFDKLWDGFSLEERRKWVSVFRDLILDPPYLREWAGVDVLEGKIRRSLDEQPDGGRQVEYWEDDPLIKGLYRKLRDYVDARSVDELMYLKLR